jgi:glycosyltransferase involved in cell wall biosynthesis
MAPTPRRIAYVDQALDTGGAEQSLVELLPLIDRRRYAPVLLHSATAAWAERPALADVRRVAVFEPSAMLEARREELRPGVFASKSHLLAAPEVSWRIHRALRAEHIDLVHTNALKSHLLAGVAAWLPRRPLVWHVRDILPESPARQWLLAACRALRPSVIAISEAVAAQFAHLTPRTPVRVIYNGVPLDRFRPGEPPAGLRAELGLDPEGEVVAVVGRLAPWKGHGTLLEAMRLVREQRPRARLLVVGEVAFWEKSFATELRRQAQAADVASATVWAGFRTDVAELLRLCDVFVLPSVNEPFGRALVEAMATGKPVIGTRSGGVPEVVKEGESGLLVEPGNVPELAAAITRVLSDRSLAADLGEAAWRRANRYFCVRRAAREVQEVYEELLGR